MLFRLKETKKILNSSWFFCVKFSRQCKYILLVTIVWLKYLLSFTTHSQIAYIAHKWELEIYFCPLVFIKAFTWFFRIIDHVYTWLSSKCVIPLYTLTSVCIFSILIPIHFFRCWQKDFVQSSWASIHGDHFLYSHDLNVRFSSDIVRRN